MRRAQSIIEYAVLFAIVASAFMAMNLYLQRATQAKLHQIQKELEPDIQVIYVNQVDDMNNEMNN